MTTRTNEALKSDNSYVLKIEYKYGTSGTMSNVTVSGTKLSPEEAYDVEKDLSYYCMDADLEDQIDDEEQTNGISIVYGMTDANYDEFISANQEEDEYVDYNYSMFGVPLHSSFRSSACSITSSMYSKSWKIRRKNIPHAI